MSIPPTLLLADDSVAIQRVVALVFADQPVRLVVAKDGQDAINRMATERPDLVLADTNMPCVDGYEVARWVRQQPHLSTVPVLLLAGITDPVDEQRLHDSGANGVLEKPFEPSHVISRVKELLGIKGASTAPPTRLVTSPDEKPIKRVLPQATPAAPPASAHAAEAPEVVANAERTHDLAHAVSFGSMDATFADQEEESPFARALPGRDGDQNDFGQDAGDEAPRGTLEDWFPAAQPLPPTPAPPGRDSGRPDTTFHRHPESTPAGIDPDFGVQFPPTGGAIRAGSHTNLSPDTADVFEALLAAEQSGTSPRDAVSAWSTGMTDETLETLASRVVEKLRPDAMRDEWQRALGTSLAEAVHHSVATETRAAVAEAVQTAVDGSILGTVRGAVNEAVSAAVRESVARAVPAAVEQSLQDVVASRVSVLVRDTVEREMRETVAPALNVMVREMLAATLHQAVADAVTAAVPTAVFEAVRQEAPGQVHQVVVETSERLVREEIARIRERR